MGIVVVGSGALGSLIAAYLTKAGQEVLLTDRPNARLDQVNAEGVRLCGFRGDLHVPVKTAALDSVHLSSPPDYILLCVHPDDMDDALSQVQKFSQSSTTFVPFVGGLAPFDLRHKVNSENAIGAVANLECRLKQDGAVETDFHNFIWLGEFDGSNSERLQKLQLALSFVAPTFLTKVIEGIIWSKAIYSVEVTLSTLVRVEPRKVFAERIYRRLAAALVRENIVLAHAAGHTPIAFDFFDPNLYQASNPKEGEVTDVWIRNAWIRHEQFRAGLEGMFDDQVGLSWLLSPENPRQEATSLLDGLLTKSDRLGYPLTLTRRLAEVHHEVTSGARSLGWENLDLLESFRREASVAVPYPEL